jgi:hypothetical protein
MFNPSEVPSLAQVLTKVLNEEGITEVVPGKVNDPEGQIFANFTIMSSDMAKMTADEIFLGYLKPATEEIGRRIAEYADGKPICTSMAKLPPEGSRVVGWRCINGLVPVNVYVARRPTPDRHQVIIETRVTRVEENEDGEA